jgi:hypothetical protein
MRILETFFRPQMSQTLFGFIITGGYIPFTYQTFIRVHYLMPHRLRIAAIIIRAADVYTPSQQIPQKLTIRLSFLVHREGLIKPS